MIQRGIQSSIKSPLSELETSPPLWRMAASERWKPSAEAFMFFFGFESLGCDSLDAAMVRFRSLPASTTAVLWSQSLLLLLYTFCLPPVASVGSGLMSPTRPLLNIGLGEPELDSQCITSVPAQLLRCTRALSRCVSSL